MEGITYYLEGVVKGKRDTENFEGPLSLILMLLSKNKIEIRDISVSLILDQYMAYMETMNELDMDVASEFVQMASYLLYIKTKMLLTNEKEISELEQLMTSLEELKARDMRESLRSVVPQLAEWSEQGLGIYTRRQEQRERPKTQYDYKHSAEELLSAILAVYSRPEAKLPAPEEYVKLAPRPIAYSVSAKCRELVDLLSNGGKLSLNTVFKMSKSRSELVATFIAILELCSVGSFSIQGEGEERSLKLEVSSESALSEGIGDDVLWN